MKRNLGLAFATLLTASVAYAQNPVPKEFQLTLTPAQQFVLASKTAPEYWNEEKGWKEVRDAEHIGNSLLPVFAEPGRMELVLNLHIRVDVYENEEADLHAEVFSWQARNGTWETFGMVYGDTDATVARYAIVLDGAKWFVAEEIAMEGGNGLLVDDAVIVQDPNGSLRPISVVVRLDTIDGAKSRLLLLK